MKEEYGSGFDGTPEQALKYAQDTPGQELEVKRLLKVIRNKKMSKTLKIVKEVIKDKLLREQANSERKTTVTPPLPERNPKIEYVNDGGWIVPRRKAKPTGWKTPVTKNGKRPTSKPTGWETTVYTKP